MCGIAGIVAKKSAIDSSVIVKMTDIIRHRGPDGQGHYYDNNLAFGHRRLAIIDLTADGHQPMHYDGDRLTITFNGEIYNYLEIREELTRAGHVFRSHSDTEVILAAYLEWGQDCVSHFNGMWAFAIHDKSRGLIFCSRDRMGVKPFYYYTNDDVFAFGSEIRQLLPLMPSRRANRGLLTDFILTGICDHTAETFFAGVEKLPASHNLLYNLADNTYAIKRYYQINKVDIPENCSPREAEERFFSVFQDAVRLRLRSDVKVGTCLSGGLDSSSVATIAAGFNKQVTDEPFCAITAVSTQESNDESAFAEIVAKNSQMNWLTVKPTYEDFVNSLDQVVTAQEEPFGGPTLTMQYFVMKTARENGITVLLDGQGGDETLLGYEKYFAAHFVSVYRQKGLLGALGAIREAGKNNARMGMVNVLKYLGGGLLPRARYLFYTRRSNFLKETPPLPQFLRDYSRSCLDIFFLQVLENTSTNLPVLLRYEDKNSMAHSIETRLPFLDYRTLETSLSLPGEYKIRDGWTKWVLRKAMAGKMPDSIVWRKNKFGFEAPERQWLKRHLPMMQATVTASPLLRSLCNMDKLAKSYTGLGMRSQWRLYSTALWEKAFEVAE